MNDVGPHYDSVLIDVTGVSLGWLRAHSGSTLAHAVRRALEEQLDQPPAIAAFQNAITFGDTAPADDS